MEYIVSDRDTIERIAAVNDVTPSALMKYNRLTSRHIFTGQKIKLPPTLPQADLSIYGSKQKIDKGRSVSLDVDTRTPNAPADQPPKPPGNAIKVSPSAEELDAECLKRFLKLKVKHFTESEGTVAGTLLVTPNCLMFDPDVSHPLVKENGPDKYGMVASMDQIMSATLYKDISAFTGETQSEKDQAEVYGRNKSVSDPTPVSSNDIVDSAKLLSIVEESKMHEPLFSVGEPVTPTSTPDIPQSPPFPLEDDEHIFDEGEENENGKPQFSSAWRPRFSSLKKLPTTPTHKRFHETKSVNFADNSSNGGRLSGFRQSLKNRATSLSGSVQSVATNVVSGTKAAGAVVTSGAHTIANSTKVVVQSGADAVQTGAHSVASGLSEGAKAIGRVPQNIVNMGTGMFAAQEGVLDIHDSWFGEDNPDSDNPSFRRQQSQFKLDALMAKAVEKRQKAAYQLRAAVEPEDKLDIFKSVDDILNQAHTANSPTSSGPELPFYFCVRLNRKMRNRRDRRQFSSVTGQSGTFGNRLKTDFWFTIPREKAEALYTFMVQWTPEKYNRPGDVEKAANDGFIVLDSDADEDLQGEECGDPVVGNFIQREWEIVTVEEVRRRLELDLAASELPLPDGATTSRILPEAMIRQIVDVLPARAEGYPWHRVYSSEEHGFSLRTLYRRMNEFCEDLSPTLFVVQDTLGDVFGACVSLPIRQSDHFTGTGDSCFLFTFKDDSNKEDIGDSTHDKQLKTYPWTGENIYFVKADKDSLAFGSGAGKIGLWIDGDFNKGRTRHCKTFNNPLLASTEDFVIENVEAWCFSMDHFKC